MLQRLWATLSLLQRGHQLHAKRASSRRQSSACGRYHEALTRAIHVHTHTLTLKQARLLSLALQDCHRAKSWTSYIRDATNRIVTAPRLEQQ